MTKIDQKELLTWYRANRRSLPWRMNRDPYRVWISETMLQQTTTTAVLGFYEKFLSRFPNLQSLAEASIENVYDYWAGLGYYSRARNLHKAAQMLFAHGEFPQTYIELLEYPGFGPYTSRAVSSIAFSEPVGVLDGNVIRVLTRKLGLAVDWWRPNVRNELQMTVDTFVKDGPSHELNQALMELGSQICTPKSPHCVQCPWLGRCAAQKNKQTDMLPLKKPRRQNEVWVWQAHICENKNLVLLRKNDYAPFLRQSWFLPGSVKKSKTRPTQYDFRHTITHHDIFVQVTHKKVNIKSSGTKKSKELELWVKRSELSQYVPAALVKKAIDYVMDKKSKKTNAK